MAAPTASGGVPFFFGPGLHRWWRILLVGALGLPPLFAGMSPALTRFDLEADDAQVALRTFAEQSGQQVIYPPQLVKGVRTRPVNGDYTARAALERMVAGTPLVVWQDEQTGALAISEAKKAEAVIALPPFVVAEEMLGWRHAEVAGYEILSRCSDATTSELIAQAYALRELLGLMVPPRLQYQSDVPSAYLFFNDQEPSPVSPELLSSLERRAKDQAEKPGARTAKLGAGPGIEALNSYAFRDQDVESTFSIWSDTKSAGFQLRLTPEYVHFLLANRAPALPPWFVEGMMEVYRSVTMTTTPQRSPGSWYDRVQGALFDNGYSITFRPMPWMSARLTKAVRKNPAADVELLPLAEVFSDRPMAIADRANNSLRAAGAIQPQIPTWLARQYEYSDNLRLSEAALFIRWALETGKEPRRRALWNFAARAGAGPVTEATFQEFFGLDYRAAEVELRAYLGVAVAKPFQLHPDRRPVLDPIDFNDATVAEISRIKGDFNRLEIAFVRSFYPALTEKYVEQARRTLRKSYDAGGRDPRLLAELGLCECDAGSDATARPFLEAAVQRRVVRPRAYYELARIRMAEFRGSDPTAKITAEQRADVLAPLLAMRGQKPELGEAYELMAEAWLRSETIPDRAQFALLQSGLALFPRRVQLVVSLALLDAAQGRFEDARALVDRGLGLTDDALMKIRLLELQGILPPEAGHARK